VSICTVFLACGGLESTGTAKTEVAFARHPLVCAKTGLAAKLEAFGQEDCPLELTAHNTVQGTCAGYPVGEAHQLRLVYYTKLPAGAQPEVLELATAASFLDLTGFEGPEAVVSFDEISHYPDDDSDGSPNIAEWCAGTDPRGP
jgi:hypothetical protein